ncbi:ankyrin repeat domain-containing protein [Candidatus Dependentiae bacterium]|nr:ankyrin repeat domain-containing protein [Candidatus Dependentiae bacterium]
MKHLFVLKDKSIESLIESYKKFLKLSKTVDKQYLEKLTDSYQRFIKKHFTEEEFQNLNLEIINSLKPLSIIKIPRNLDLLVRLLAFLGKLDITITDDRKITMLMGAARLNLKNLADALIKAGTDINAKDEDGKTALIWASGVGHDKMVELLIKAKANLNEIDSTERNALMSLIANSGPYQHHTDAAKLLIDAKIDLSAKDKFGWTALMLAQMRSEKEIVDMLLQAGAKE